MLQVESNPVAMCHWCLYQVVIFLYKKDPFQMLFNKWTVMDRGAGMHECINTKTLCFTFEEMEGHVMTVFHQMPLPL